MQIVEKRSKVDEIINSYNSSGSMPANYQDVEFPKYLEEEPKKKWFNLDLSETPIPRAYEEKLPFVSSFYTSFESLFTVDFFSNPVGFICKSLSLFVQPLIFAIGAYLFFSLFMWWERYLALIPALYLYFLTLTQLRCLGFRPTPRETLGLFCHQVALVWLGWTLGSMAYCISKAQFNYTTNGATIIGLVVAWFVYDYCLPYVSAKVGASNLLTYLTQVAKVFVGTLASVLVGYGLSAFIWNWFFEPKIDLLDFNFFTDSDHLRMHTIAMFFGFVGFWVSVNLYYGTVRKSKRPEERGDEIFEI